jgi:protein TonB
MIKYKKKPEDDPVKFLKNRFYCSLTKEDRAFQADIQYRKILELSLLISLTLFLILFQVSKRIEERALKLRTPDLVFNVEDIPQTQQMQKTIAPSRPSVPIASEDEALPDDETIELTFLDLDEVPPPPPPLPTQEDQSQFVFVPYDEAPEPIGGVAAILRNIEYPEVGKRASIEGTVILHVQIDEKGVVRNMRVIKGIGFDIFETAAMNAVKSVRWRPAKQRDVPVKVWISVPIEFDLTDEA